MFDKIDKSLEEIFNFKSDGIPIKDYFPKEYEQFKEIIKKADKYDDLMNANHEVIQNNTSLTQLHQENKQLENHNDELVADDGFKILELEEKLEKINDNYEAKKFILSLVIRKLILNKDEVRIKGVIPVAGNIENPSGGDCVLRQLRFQVPVWQWVAPSLRRNQQSHEFY